MPRCRIDRSLTRVVVGGFEFPLGVYPVEDMKPREGYTVAFEKADGGGDAPEFPIDRPDPDDSGDFGSTLEDGRRDDPFSGAHADRADLEAWPDRYVWDIVIRSSRLEALIRALLAMLPGRVYPILDVLGSDAYREIDPYVAYELVGQERVIEGLRLFRGFLLEDGLVGFGAMADEPFLYVFVDEHKICTVRAETSMREKVERLLAAFDLEEVREIAGADAALHEHRTVLEAPDDRPDLVNADEAVEELKDLWGLSLNVDGERNLDDRGEELGVCGWRCLVRAILDGGECRYVEALLTADCLNTAQDMAGDAAEIALSEELTRAKAGADEGDPTLDIVTADRLKPEEFVKAVKDASKQKPDLTHEDVWAVRLIE
ncbi:MAG: hypothetical protein AB7K52_04135 [Phycisphaerales bacterium]